MKKNTLTGLLVFIAVLIVSCSNFTEGFELKNSIDKKIKYEQSGSCLVKIAAEKGSGVTTPNNEEKKKPTDSFNIDFDINEAYKFSRWIAVNLITEEPLPDAVSFEPVDSIQTKATILDSKKDIWIKPLCYKIGTADILISSECGDTTPSTTESYRTGSTYNLAFSEDDEYCFVEWRVVDLNKITDNIIPDEKYISFGNKKNYNTTFTVLGIPEEEDNVALSIQPYCVLRPKVVSHTPTYESNGVIRNTRIRVLFSQNMSEESIYFTEKEMESLQNLNPGIEFLPATKNSPGSGEKFYYGYTLNGQTYFKNISITELSDSDSSLCNYFSEPYFANKRSLIIPTKKGKSAPPEATDIMVDISKKMVSDQYRFNVNLKEGDSWQYLVNDEVDDISPVFKSLNITDDAQTEDQSIFPSRELIGTAFSLSNLFYSKNHKFLVNAEIYDKSGISELQIEMQKVLGNTYKEGAELLKGESVTIYQVPLKVIGDTAKCKNTEIDLSDYADGVYKMTFKAIDNSGESAVYGILFYITRDYTPVEISTLKLQVINTNGTKELDPTNICPTPYDSDSISKYQACYSDNGIIKVTGTLPLQYESDVESIEVKAFKYSSELFDTAAGAMNQPVGTYNIDFTQTEADYKISDFNINLSPYGNGLYRLEVLVKDKAGNIASSTLNAVLDSLAELEFAGPEFFIGNFNSDLLSPEVLNTYKINTSASPFQTIKIVYGTTAYTTAWNATSNNIGPFEAGTIFNEDFNSNSYKLSSNVVNCNIIKSVCRIETRLPASSNNKTISNETALPPAIIIFSKDDSIEVKYKNRTFSGSIVYDYVDLYLDDSKEQLTRLTEGNSYTITGLNNGKKYKITAIAHSESLDDGITVVPSVMYETPSPYPLDGYILYRDDMYSSYYYAFWNNSYYDVPIPMGMVYDLNSETKKAKLLALTSSNGKSYTFRNKAFASTTWHRKSTGGAVTNSYYTGDADIIYTPASNADYKLEEMLPAAYYALFELKEISSKPIVTARDDGQIWYIPSISELKKLVDDYGWTFDNLAEGAKTTGSNFPEYRKRFWSSTHNTSKVSKYETYVNATTEAYYYDFTERNVNPKSCDKATALKVLYIADIDLSKF